MNGEMKPYETPKAEVLVLSEEDVVKTSGETGGGSGSGGSGGGNELPVIPIG